MKRVLVIGNCGSGKTTFSRNLAKITALPVLHLDSHFWQNNWKPTPRPEWNKKVLEMVRSSRWIIDGNYKNSFDIRVPRADTIIFLDYPLWLCTWRILYRYFRNPLKERLSINFMLKVIRFSRAEVYSTLKMQLQPHQKLIIFRNDEDAKKYLQNEGTM